MDWKEVLQEAKNVLVIDWPSKEVPETLACAGLHVIVRSGPGPEDYAIYECDASGTVTRRKERAPKATDLVYAHRPLTELPAIIATAKALHANAIWIQSGLSASGAHDPRGCWMRDEEQQRAAELVQAAGLKYFNEPYIADAIQQVRALKL